MAREISCEDKSRNNTNNMVSSGGGFCYSEISPTSNHQSLHTQFTTSQIQHFDHDHQPNNNNTEIFNLTTGMDMIGFSKSTNTNTTTDHDHHHHSIQSNNSSVWKGFNKPHDHHHHQFTAGISESPSTSDHHHHHNQNFIVGPDHHQSGAWQENNNIRPFMVDDSSLRCVFPCEGNERPSQGLSLTLSSNNPSSIGLQAFELRHTTNIHHQQQQLNNFSHNLDGFLGNKSQNNLSLLLQQQQQAGHFELRNSKFLSPAQDILNEFCSLGPKQTDMPKQKSHKSKLQWELDQDSNNNTNGASSSKKHSLYSLEFMELQKRKTRLLSMLEEVERRYKKYCDQMKELVSSFEAVAGPGAAAVYSALASKAMSRHFRCLKDGIVAQIQATRKAMGEKDVASSSSSAPGGPGGVPGMSRGETPRLRALDQALRQQRAFQQMSMMESHPWRPQRGLPERSVSVLRAWLFEHFLHPYPSDVDKHILARQTGLSRSQVSNWFINARVRLWKPMVEEMYIEETKEAQLDGTIAAAMAAGSSSDGGGVDILSLVDPTSGGGGRNLTSSRPDHHDQKPSADQLVRMDSECFSSVVNNAEKADFMSMRSTPKTLQQAALMNSQIRHQNFGRFPEAGGPVFGAVELDFSSYNAVPSSSSSSAAVLYSAGPTVAANQGFGGVSLTLGLQQHAGTAGGVNHHHNGVSLAFSPATQGSLFFPRSSTNHHHDHHNIADHDHDQDDDDQCQPGVQYSLLDGDQGQNLPYRNLMGAQLLHDLA